MLFLSFSSPDLPLRFSPLAVLQLAFTPSVEALLNAAARRTLALSSLRGPTGGPQGSERQGPLETVSPGLLATFLRRKDGTGYHKAELLVNFYILCFDYEEQQTHRMLAAATAAASAPAPATAREAGGALQHQRSEEQLVSNAFVEFLEETGGPAETAFFGLWPGFSGGSSPAGSSCTQQPDDRCGGIWGPFAVAEAVGLLDVAKVSEPAADRFRCSLARAVVQALRLCCVRAAGQPQRDAELEALRGACSVMMGNSLRHSDTWTEVLQKLGTLLYSHGLAGSADLLVGTLQGATAAPLVSAEEVHAALRALLPTTLPVSPFFSLRAPNQSLFYFVFRGFEEAWRAWGFQHVQQQQHHQNQQQHQQKQHQQENEAVLGVLSAHISSATAALLEIFFPLVSSCQEMHASLRGSFGGLLADDADAAVRSGGPQGGADELFFLQCLLFVCECGRESFASAMCSPPTKVLKKQAQSEGGGFFGLPYAGLQRWLHLVAAFLAVLESHTGFGASPAVPNFPSLLVGSLVLLLLLLLKLRCGVFAASTSAWSR